MQANPVIADAARESASLVGVGRRALLFHLRNLAEQIDFERRAVVALQQRVAKTQVLRQGEVPVEIDRLSAVRQPIELPFRNRLADPQFGHAFERRHAPACLPAVQRYGAVLVSPSFRNATSGGYVFSGAAMCGTWPSPGIRCSRALPLGIVLAMNCIRSLKTAGEPGRLSSAPPNTRVGALTCAQSSTTGSRYGTWPISACTMASRG